MKRINKIFLICVFIVSLAGCSNTNNEETKHIMQNSKKITLNRLPQGAAGEEVSSVEVTADTDGLFEKDEKVYEVIPHEYSDKDIQNVAETLGIEIEERKKENDNVKQYSFDNGGYLTCYHATGSLSYISNYANMDDGTRSIQFNKKKCKQIAEKFIKESEILEMDDMELVNIDVCQSVEKYDGTEIPISYSVYYKKCSPSEGVDYYGVGPGIKIEIDNSYSIHSFISVDKDISATKDSYRTISEDDMIDAILDGSNVSIDGSSEGEKLRVKIDDVSLCLYSDPVTEEQEYMAPYYVLSGEDENNSEVTIVVPAIEEEFIQYK